MDLKNIKTIISSTVLLIAFALYVVFGDAPKDKKTTDSSQAFISKQEVEEKTNNKAFKVEYVQTYDGDTIKVLVNGQKESIRMLLIDSPEMRDKEDGKQPYAQEATDLTKSILENAKTIEIVYDVGQQRDKYDRLLAYVFADDVLVQEELLENGLAAVRYIYKPNNTLEQDFYKLQQAAQDEKLNIWSQNEYFQKDGYHPEVIR